jgi:class 3 adenylate cyclase
LSKDAAKTTSFKLIIPSAISKSKTTSFRNAVDRKSKFDHTMANAVDLEDSSAKEEEEEEEEEEQEQEEEEKDSSLFHCYLPYMVLKSIRTDVSNRAREDMSASASGPIAEGFEKTVQSGVVKIQRKVARRSSLTGVLATIQTSQLARAESGIVPRACTVDCAVLFSDLSGFTALTERLAARQDGAEALCKIINGYFAALLSVIEAHGGDVMKFAGDAMCIAWPVMVDGVRSLAWSKSLKEAAIMGARCSSALHECIESFDPTSLYGAGEGAKLGSNARLTLHQGMGVGQTTLLFVGGVYGRWEYVMAGAPMDQMAIAEPLAEDGSTVFSPQVWEMVKDVCEGSPCKKRGHHEYMVQGAFKSGFVASSINEACDPRITYAQKQHPRRTYTKKQQQISRKFIPDRSAETKEEEKEEDGEDDGEGPDWRKDDTGVRSTDHGSPQGVSVGGSGWMDSAVAQAMVEAVGEVGASFVVNRDAAPKPGSGSGVRTSLQAVGEHDDEEKEEKEGEGTDALPEKLTTDIERCVHIYTCMAASAVYSCTHVLCILHARYMYLACSLYVS